MPLYKDQGVVLGSIKLAEADKIVTVLTQGSGKVRAVAKGLRRTTSRFGARLEPFTHVDLMLYRGRSLDTVTQAEIVHPFRTLREDYSLVAAGATMLEAADKVAEEHERNVPLFLLLVKGLRALETRPASPRASPPVRSAARRRSAASPTRRAEPCARRTGTATPSARIPTRFAGWRRWRP